MNAATRIFLEELQKLMQRFDVGVVRQPVNACNDLCGYECPVPTFMSTDRTIVLRCEDLIYPSTLPLTENS